MTKDEMAEMDCAHAVELLPWLLNESLEDPERAALRRHLDACAGCRRELAATARAGRALGQHPSTETLVAYALGHPLEGLSREVVEGHLAGCETCREELELVRRDDAPADLAPPSSSASPSPPGGWRGWRPLALAASLATVLTGSALVFQVAQRDARSREPEVNVAVIELLPERALTRGAELSGGRLDPAGPTVVVLITDLAEIFDGYRVRMIGADRAVRWQSTGLEPGPDGDFTLLLPAASQPAAEVTLELEGLRGGEWIALESYRLGP